MSEEEQIEGIINNNEEPVKEAIVEEVKEAIIEEVKEELSFPPAGVRGCNC